MSHQDVYFDFPQSRLYEHLEDRRLAERAARIACGETSDLPSMANYKPTPLFPATSPHLVIWGLDDVLVKISDKIEAAYKTRTAEVLAGMLGKEVDTADVCKLVHKGYEECGQPCKYVAAKYGVDEGMLQMEMLARVAYQDIALRPNHYGMGDQGLINFFEASREKGHVHAVVTSASGAFARTCLQFSVLAHHMGGIFGSESRLGNRGEMLPKSVNPDAFLDMVVPAEHYADRYPSIIVADHNLDFLAAAQARGMKTVLIDLASKFGVKPSEADYKFDSPKGVFEMVLGIKDPGSRRDAHIYAGIGPVPSASPK